MALDDAGENRGSKCCYWCDHYQHHMLCARFCGWLSPVSFNHHDCRGKVFLPHFTHKQTEAHRSSCCLSGVIHLISSRAKLPFQAPN